MDGIASNVVPMNTGLKQSELAAIALFPDLEKGRLLQVASVSTQFLRPQAHLRSVDAYVEKALVALQRRRLERLRMNSIS